MGLARTKNRDVQKRLELGATFDQIVQVEQELNERAAGGAKVKPNISDIKEMKAIEKDQNRRKQKFKPTSKANESPKQPATNHHDGTDEIGRETWRKQIGKT